jgi:hypothetical protein
MPSLGDLMYALAEWLRTTPLVELALWLSEQPLSMAISGNFWVIPTLQSIHILALAASFGSILMLGLRVLGWAGGSRTVGQAVRRYMPWVWWAFLILLLTGLGMIIGEPDRELLNPVFWTKVVLVLLTVLLTFWFQASVRRGDLDSAEVAHDGRIAVRLGAVGIILLWCTVMVAGRWIAYAPV